MPDAIQTLPEGFDLEKYRQKLSQAEQVEQPRTSFMENLIDTIPLAMAAGTGDDQFLALIQGISDRRKQQKRLDFEQSLDLKKFQLESALSGLRMELLGVEERRRQLESAAQIRASEAQTDTQKLLAQKAGMDIEEAKATTTSRIGKIHKEFETEKVRTKAVEAELKSQEEQFLLHQIKRQVAQEMLNGTPEERDFARTALLTGEQPRGKETFSALAKDTLTIFPELQHHRDSPSAESAAIFSGYMALTQKFGAIAKPIKKLSDITASIKQRYKIEPDQYLTKEEAQAISKEDKEEIFEYLRTKLNSLKNYIYQDPQLKESVEEELKDLAREYGLKYKDLLKAYEGEKEVEKPISSFERVYGTPYQDRGIYNR